MQHTRACRHRARARDTRELGIVITSIRCMCRLWCGSACVAVAAYRLKNPVRQAGAGKLRAMCVGRRAAAGHRVEERGVEGEGGGERTPPPPPWPPGARRRACRARCLRAGSIQVGRELGCVGRRGRVGTGRGALLACPSLRARPFLVRRPLGGLWGTRPSLSYGGKASDSYTTDRGES